MGHRVSSIMLQRKAAELKRLLKLDVTVKQFKGRGYSVRIGGLGRAESPTGTKEMVWDWLDAYETGFRDGFKAHKKVNVTVDVQTSIPIVIT